ncbi:MAG: hypothetical protein II249_06025 [Bacteroidaceae bacterium]|nr:hypothetical protein [Bacteroidaceae bacterium]
MDNKGWICLHRKMIDWEWFSKPEMVQLFIFLLLRASVKEAKWQGLVIKRGQLVTSVASISTATKLTAQKIRTCLQRLEDSGQIERKTTNKFTIITICNYESYQDKQDDDQQANNKQITNKQQTTNKQITTYKQYNNNNNITIDSNIDPTEQEFERFWDIYDKKVGNKQKLLQKWRKLKEDERNAIFETLPKYVAATPEKKYRLNPETYLNNKSWNNEIITDNGRSNSQQDRKHFETSAGINFKTRADFEI